MQEVIYFPKFIVLICTRPNMYTLRGTFNEVVAYIMGYSQGSNSPIEGFLFGRYVCLKHSFPFNYHWSGVLRSTTPDDEKAIALLQATILEFLDLKQTKTEEEILQFALDNAVVQEESEAVQVFRQFDRALLTGDKALIQSLIINSEEEAAVLWRGAYPADVAEQLQEMTDDSPINCTPVDQDGKVVQILASGWPFCIEMLHTEEGWKVDAAPIIHLWDSHKIK